MWASSSIKVRFPNKTAFAIKLRRINVVPSSPLPQGSFFLVLPRQFSDSKVFIRGSIYLKNIIYFTDRCEKYNADWKIFMLKKVKKKKTSTDRPSLTTHGRVTANKQLIKTGLIDKFCNYSKIKQSSNPTLVEIIEK